MSIDPKKIHALVGGAPSGDAATIASMIARAPRLVAAAEEDHRNYDEAFAVCDRLNGGVYGHQLTPAQRSLVASLLKRLRKVLQENEHRL